MSSLKKIISAALSATMLLSAIPLNAYADEVSEDDVTQSEDVEDVIDETNPDDTDNSEEPTEPEEPDEPDEVFPNIAILFVNDVHGSIAAHSNNYGYAELAAYRARLEEQGYITILADAGDFSQGTALAAYSRGEDITGIMGDVGFDIVTIGDRDFDYGMDNLISLASSSFHDTVVSNLLDESGQKVFDGYKIIDIDNMHIGFVGISTPESITKTNYLNFQNEDGEYIYSFCEGNNGADLYANVQSSVDAAREEGADYVIALSHLGTNDSSKPYRSTDVIANTTGIDAVIDGHSHSVLSTKKKNQSGEDVVLASAGSNLSNMGVVYIEDGVISSKTVAYGYYKVPADTESDEYYIWESVNETVKDLTDYYSSITNSVIAQSENDLIRTDPKNTSSVVIRSKETNLGDLCADAYRSVTDADIALVRSGTISQPLKAGEYTYSKITSVINSESPLCVVEATGQEILDALEFSTYLNPKETAEFLQVSGIEFTLNSFITPSVELTTDKKFKGVNGKYRVQKVKVGDFDLDLDATYTVVSDSDMLKGQKSAYSMFTDNKMVKTNFIYSNEALAEYVENGLGGYIEEPYSEAYGDGRIKILDSSNQSGEKQFWEFDSESGILTIEGTESMYDYKDGKQPWYELIGEITVVEIKGDPGIKINSFAGCKNLSSVIINNDEEYYTRMIGDVSSNGSIDLMDAVMVAKSIVGSVKFNEYDALIADYNKSGTIDLMDVIGIAKAMLEKK